MTDKDTTIYVVKYMGLQYLYIETGNKITVINQDGDEESKEFTHTIFKLINKYENKKLYDRYTNRDKVDTYC